MSEDVWERHADWWQAGFSQGADAEYEEQILPLVSSRLRGITPVLDVGTGEGQLARRLAACGAAVVGVDRSKRQLAEAHRRGDGVAYVRAGASALPFAGGSFKAVVICLVIEHLEDASGAFAEVGRVLEAGGSLLLAMNHPLFQTPGSGWIDDQILHEQYWRIGRYLDEATTVEEVEPGVRMPFFHRPLSHYVNLMARNGLVVTGMEEPPPPPGFLARAPEYVEAQGIPRLMVIHGRKLIDGEMSCKMGAAPVKVASHE